MPDPGAKSGAVSFVTQTVGLANYVVFKPEAGQLRLDQAFDDGAVIKYMVTNGADISIERGTVTLPDTLTRAEFITSNTGAPISWPETGQRTVWPISEALPLCDIEPTDGQVLIWNEAEQNWCPGDIVSPPSPATDCGVDMQNVDSGTSYSVTITKCETQVIWNSTDPGEKDTTIAAVGADQDGYQLNIKANTGDGSVHCVTPTGATIGGLDSDTFDDQLCDLALVYNHAKTDWMIRCLCCYTPTPCEPVIVPVVPDCAQGIEILVSGFFQNFITSRAGAGSVPSGLVPDSTEFTLSFWYKLNELPTGYQFTLPAGFTTITLPSQFYLFTTSEVDSFFSGHGFSVGIANILGNPGISFVFYGRDDNHFYGVFNQSSNFPSLGVWHHVALSFDSNSGSLQMYVDDAAVSYTSDFAYAPVLPWGGFPAVNMNWSDITDINIAIMDAQTGSSFGGFISRSTPIDFKHVWFKADVGLDLSAVPNRRKLIDGSGNPAALGANGEIPTGSVATAYLCGWPNLTAGLLGPYFTNYPSANSIDIAPTPTQPKVGQP